MMRGIAVARVRFALSAFYRNKKVQCIYMSNIVINAAMFREVAIALLTGPKFLRRRLRSLYRNKNVVYESHSNGCCDNSRTRALLTGLKFLRRRLRSLKIVSNAVASDVARQAVVRSYKFQSELIHTSFSTNIAWVAAPDV